MSVEIMNQTTYVDVDDNGNEIWVSNDCDGTTNPFKAGGDLWPKDDERWIEIETLKMMKRVIDRALRDAKNSEKNEYVKLED